MATLQTGAEPAQAALLQQWATVPLFSGDVHTSTQVGVALHFALAWQVTDGPPPVSIKFAAHE